MVSPFRPLVLRAGRFWRHGIVLALTPVLVLSAAVARADKPSSDEVASHALPALVDPLNPRYGQNLAGRTGVVDGVVVEYLTLADIYERLDNNEDWQRYVQTQLEAAHAARARARAFEDPTLSYDVAGHVRGNDFVDGSQHAFLIEWEAPLRRVRQRRAAVVEADVARIRQELANDREDYDQLIRVAWAGVEVALVRVALLYEAIHRIQELVDRIDKEVQHGARSPYERERIRFRIAQLAEDYEQSLDYLVLQSMYTAQLVGVDNWLPLPRKLWEPPQGDQRAFADRRDIDPAVLQAQAEAALARAEAQQARSDRTPTVVLQGGVQVATTPNGLAGLGGISMRLPLFGAGRAAVKNADAAVAASEASAVWIKTTSMAQRDASVRDWQFHFDALRRYDRVLVPQTVALESMARTAYLGGVIGFAEFLEAVETRVETSLARISLIEQLAEQEVILQRWIGRPEPARVEIANEPDDDSVSFEND